VCERERERKRERERRERKRERERDRDSALVSFLLHLLLFYLSPQIIVWFCPHSVQVFSLSYSPTWKSSLEMPSQAHRTVLY
jgi:hypothetical protein